jgi:O-antigen/teichoic acid export membrane protein
MGMKKPTTLALYRAISDVIAKGTFFLLTVLAARRLSAQSFGLFAFGSTLGWMIGVVTDAGLQIHLARRVAQASQARAPSPISLHADRIATPRADPGQAGLLLAKWLPIRFAAAAIAFAATLVIVRAVVTDRTAAIAIVLLVTAYIVNSLVEFLNYFYRGLGRTDIESTLTMAARLAALVIGGCVLLWQPTVTALALSLLAPAIGALWWSVLKARALGRAPSPGRKQAPAGPVWREFVTDVLPIGAAVVLSALYFRIDVFLIEWWRGPEEVGAYNAVFRVVEALRLFPAAAVAVALPHLFRATTIQGAIRLGAALAGLAAIAAAIVWALAGWLIPFCYGADYARAVPAFRILLLAFPLMSLNYALTHQLIGWNRHRAYAALCAAALAFNVLLNARLIPELSIVGAAWTTVWTEVMLTAGCAALLWGGLPAGDRSAIEAVVAS